MQNMINFQSYISAHPTAFALLVAWSIAWKGFSLWKAGRNNSPIWFIVLLIVNTFGILEIIYLFAIKNKEVAIAPAPVPAPEVKEEVKTETKIETVEEKKEVVTVPMSEEKADEINHQEMKSETVVTEEITEEVKQEINQ